MKQKEQTLDTAIIVKSLEKESKKESAKILDLLIKSPEDKKIMAELLSSLKKKVVEAKAKESEIIDPMQLSVKRVKALFKPFYDSAALVESEGKKRLIEWEEEQEKRQAKLEEKYNEGKISVTKYLQSSDDLKSEKSAASTRSIDTLVVEDVEKIPRKYMVPDERLILADLKAGKKVAGCKLEKRKSITIR